MVYADLIFILNSGVDLLLLYLTATIRRQRRSFWRLCLAALLGGGYSLCYLWPMFSPAFTLSGKLLISVLMVLIAFGYASLSSLGRNLLIFYLLCFMFGGAVLFLQYALNVKGEQVGITWLVLICGILLAWVWTRYSFTALSKCEVLNTYLTEVRMQFLGKELCLAGLIDTGNQLYDPITKTPVMLVEFNWLKKILPVEVAASIRGGIGSQLLAEIPALWMNRIRFIPYKVVGREHRLLLALKPDEVYIMYGTWQLVKKVLIGVEMGGLSPDGTYQSIIHPGIVKGANQC